MQVIKSLNAIMSEIGAIEKSRQNKQQNYAFRGIEDLYAAGQPLFVKHGVVPCAEVIEQSVNRYEIVKQDGSIRYDYHAILRIKFTFYALDGSSVSVTTCGEGLDNSDKAVNKATSGAMKYALITLLQIPTQDMEDSDRGSNVHDGLGTRKTGTSFFNNSTVASSNGSNTATARTSLPVPTITGDLTFDPEYVVPFGKFRNKKLIECNKTQLLNYIQWLQKDADSKGETMSEDKRKFILMANNFCAAPNAEQV